MKTNYQAAYDACIAYDNSRKTVGSLILFYAVDAMFRAYLNYQID